LEVIHDSGVIDERVDATVARDRQFNQALCVLFPGDIAGSADYASASGADGSLDFLQALYVSVTDYDVRAFGRKEYRRCAPDSRGGPRDDSALATQSHASLLLIPFHDDLRGAQSNRHRRSIRIS
jgi:hypothetical protein